MLILLSSLLTIKFLYLQVAISRLVIELILRAAIYIISSRATAQLPLYGELSRQLITQDKGSDVLSRHES